MLFEPYLRGQGLLEAQIGLFKQSFCVEKNQLSN